MGYMMILPDFKLHSRINLIEKYTGIDTIELCLDDATFKNYPYDFVYQYNSRGFRDAEWPNDLKNSIWCIGDSYTVGLGAPIEHTWPYILQQQISRTINVSMDGASNQWISRKTVRLINEITPKIIVLQWSYIHRRELEINRLHEIVKERCNNEWDSFFNQIKGPTWKNYHLADFYHMPDSIRNEIIEVHMKNYSSRLNQWLESLDSNNWELFDEDRRLHYTKTTEIDDYDNFIKNFELVEHLCKNKDITLVHSFIPDFAKSSTQEKILETILTQSNNIVMPFKKLDVARDGHHYDKFTATYYVDQIGKILNRRHAIV